MQVEQCCEYILRYITELYALMPANIDEDLRGVRLASARKILAVSRSGADQRHGLKSTNWTQHEGTSGTQDHADAVKAKRSIYRLPRAAQ